MYKEGVEVMSAVFTPTPNNTYMDWLSMETVAAEGTYYTDLYDGQTYNIFSIEG